MATRARVLLVDDNPELRELARAALDAEGHDVECARDGFAALTVLDRFLPDILLLDMDMPQIDGRELLAMLHRTYGRVLPFVVIVASGTETERTSPGRWFLAKPYTMETLARVVADFAPARKSTSLAPAVRAAS